jgi:predicted transcriptional regulator
MIESEPLPPLSEAQTEIMNVVWEKGEATLAQVCAGLSSDRDLAKNTVQTQLTRLLEKGWLNRRAEGKNFWYSASVPQERAQTRMVQRLVDAVFGGSAEGLVMSLLDGRRLTAEEAGRIHALIQEAEERNV